MSLLPAFHLRSKSTCQFRVISKRRSAITLEVTSSGSGIQGLSSQRLKITVLIDLLGCERKPELFRLKGGDLIEYMPYSSVKALPGGCRYKVPIEEARQEVGGCT